MGRKWGQHFLRSPQVVQDILMAAELSSDDLVLEIGPGEGVLTKELCQRCEQVHAFEIDPHLAQKLEQKAWPQLSVHQGDFLKSELGDESFKTDSPIKVVANLPYYITAPILEKLTWQQALPIERAVLMMQEEVARRVCEPGQRSAGALSYIVGAFFEAEYLFLVPPSAFSPPPKVDSAVICLKPRNQPEITESTRRNYERLVATSFRSRRKQLRKSLSSLQKEAAKFLEAADIDGQRRPETLTVQEFWKLARKWPE